MDDADWLHDEELTSPPWGEAGRVATLGVVSAFSKLLLNGLNRTEVRNRAVLDKHIMQREPGVGLLTVCNHTSTFDDPGVICAMLPWSFFLTEHLHHGNRWTLCAQEICYSNWLFGQFFRSGKVLPIDRQGGIEQPVMGITSHRLARGDWVHVFPEGRVSFSGEMVPCKRGVGKLVCDYVNETGSPPIVLPFYHSGMGEIKRRYSNIFSIGHDLVVTMGEPIEVPQEVCDKCRAGGTLTRAAWADITALVQQSLVDLEARSPPNVNQPARERKPDPGPTPA